MKHIAQIYIAQITVVLTELSSIRYFISCNVAWTTTFIRALVLFSLKSSSEIFTSRQPWTSSGKISFVKSLSFSKDGPLLLPMLDLRKRCVYDEKKNINFLKRGNWQNLIRLINTIKQFTVKDWQYLSLSFSKEFVAFFLFMQKN